jgi:hypothetical protein
MLLFSHLAIALTSLIVATLCLFTPTAARLKLNYILMAATLASGTALVWVTKAPLLASCLSGLGYLSLVGVLTGLAKYRWSAQRSNQ